MGVLPEGQTPAAPHRLGSKSVCVYMQAAVDSLKLQLALQGGSAPPPIVQRDYKYSSSMDKQDGGVAAAAAAASAGTQAGDCKDPQGGREAASGGGSSPTAPRGSGAGAGERGGAGGRGSAQGGAEGLLPMLESMLADKASKVGFSALRGALVGPL